MRPGDDRKQILFVALKKEAQPVLGQLRAAGHQVSLVEDLDEAQALLGSGGFEQAILPAATLSSVLEQRLAWESSDTEAWRRSVGALAHDLQNLLQALQRAIDESDFGASDEARLVEFAGVRHTISVLSSFLRELSSELSNASGQELQLSEIDLEDAIETAAIVVYPLALEREQRLVIDIDEGVARIRADGSKLKRILSNLLEYASRQTPRHGSVTVRAYREQETSVICIAYPGEVRRSELRRLFSPAGPKEGPASIGLAGVQRLVQLHGGRVWLESQRWSGTSIFVALPLMVDAPAGRPAASLQD